MRYYFVGGLGDIEEHYYATLKQAKQVARTLAEDLDRDIEIMPVEVSTRKAELLIRLNGVFSGGETFGDVVYVAKAGAP